MSPKNPDVKIEDLIGVGEKLKHSFHKIGIFYLRDLIYFLPRKILNLENVISISKAKTLENQSVVIKARVLDLSIIRTKFKRMWIIEALLEDKTGAIRAVWFNQPFIHKNLIRNDEYVFYGQISTNQNKIFLNSPEVYFSSGIFPIYRQTKNLSSKRISKIISKILKPSLMPPDILPKEVIATNNLLDFFSAARAVHAPQSESEFARGRYRFLFEELFTFALTNQFIKNQFEKEKSYKIKIERAYLSNIISKLPFRLTADQKKTLKEVTDDLSSPRPMNRLIQGDVGSGKTIIAFLACVLAIKNGYKSIFMAPTEILCDQHFQTFKNLAKILKLPNLKIALISGKKKDEPKDANLFVGTHALINKKINNLALIVIDEQQRFGVEQRNTLLEGSGHMPHYLSLSATPIPRSLFHVIFSSCELSQIMEKPSGREKIKTFLVPEEKRKSSYAFVDSLIKKGQQVFVVCPLIEQNTEFSIQNAGERKAVNEEMERLKKTILGKRKIAILHGRLSAAEKQITMEKFKNKKIDILVSTSVVEVGIDIKNASVIIIEDADSFGLAQLHQFRGRVGRGEIQSYCLIFSSKLFNPISKQRLKAFVQNDDGFELANFDLKLRGPGAFFDTDQSGFRGINPLWFENGQMLKDATSSARRILPEIDKHPILREKIKALANLKRLE